MGTGAPAIRTHLPGSVLQNSQVEGDKCAYPGGAACLRKMREEVEQASPSSALRHRWQRTGH